MNRKNLGNGLKNTGGVNCYANSLFQAINNVDILKTHFLGVSEESHVVSYEMKKILKMLNTPSKDPIDLSENILKIINSEGNNEILRPNEKNDVSELYDAIMSSAIKEELNLRYSRSIFHDCTFFDKYDVINNYLISKCTIRRQQINKKEKECEYSLFIPLNYQSSLSFEKLIEQDFYNQFMLVSSNPDLIVLLFENSALRMFDMILQENIMFNNKKYGLKSFCINKGGDNGHYIARIVKDNKIIEYNDEVVLEYDYDLSKSQGNVRLAFYETRKIE